MLLASCAPIMPAEKTNPIPTSTTIPEPSLTPTPNRTATVQAQVTMLALTPSKNPRLTPTITPTLDFSTFANRWKIYRNEDYPISFEYPAIYDEEPYSQFGCNINVSTNDKNVYFDIGERVNADHQTLEAYVDKFIKDNEGSDFKVVSREDGTVGGVKSTTIQYRFGGTGRLGVVTYFERENKIYGLDFTAGVFCENMVGDSASGMTEFTTYFHILESFQFTR